MRAAAVLSLLLVACGAARGSDEPTPASTETAGTEAPLPEGAYRVLLSRPSQPGDTFRERSAHRRTRAQQVTVEGVVVEQTTEVVEVELVATLRVRAASSRGEPTEVDYSVERCVVRDEGGERDVVPSGSALRVARVPLGERDGRIALVGGALSEETLELLEMVISTHYSPAGNDPIFGSAQPRRVGDQWPIDAAAAARDIGKIPSIAVGEGHVGGWTRVEESGEVDGVPCLLIRSELRATDVELTGLPAGATTELATLDVALAGAFPLDLRMGRLRSVEEVEMNVRMRLARPDGTTALLEMRSHDLEATERIR